MLCARINSMQTQLLRERIRGFWTRYERHATAIAFIAGFIVDSLTLRRVDLWIENLVFIAYLAIAGACIVLSNAYGGGRLAGRFGSNRSHWLPIIMQFAFGALMSGFFVFYSRSATLARSWPFLLLLVGLAVGNEVFKKRYALLTFQVSVFFVVAFSYAIFAVPVALRSLGVHTFLVSGIAGLAIVVLLLTALGRVSPARFAESRTRIIASVAAIYLAFNLLYFTKSIPPIPLALKDIGVYHSVERAPSGDYRVTYEPVRWYELGKRIRPVFHRIGDEPVYVFSAVFAPTRLTAPILHRWSRYDERSGRWVQTTAVRFTIFGARDGGYRGYSLKTNLEPGRWRVDVITERDELIGRIAFRIEPVSVAPFTETGFR